MMKIKILYVSNYIVNGGPSNVIRNLAANLDPGQYDITVMNLFSGSDPEIVKELEQMDIRVIQCSTMTRMGGVLGKDREFRKIAEVNHYDVIHTHGFVPDILSSRLKTSAKRITTLHNNMFEDYVQSYGAVKSKIFIPMHLHAIKRLDQAVCCAESVYDVMNKYVPNTTYVRNGIDAKENKEVISREELGIPTTACVFVYAGHLSALKRTAWLAEQFDRAHSKDEYLLLLGQGEQLEACQKFESEHLKLLGFQKNVRKYLQMADVYVSASCSEGFSISIIEALECGLGLLLSDIPSHCEVVNMDEDIYLGENFEFLAKSFAQAMEKLRNNRSRLNKQKISDFKERELSGRIMTERYEKYYK